VELKDINKLIDKVTEKGITDFEMEREGFKIRITKKAPNVIQTETTMAPTYHQVAPLPQQDATQSSAAPAKPDKIAEESDNNFHVIASPMVGTFYRAPSPGAKPYISVGDRVKKGQVCCIVEAMKIMNEIQSDVEGVVQKVHVENEQPVEFGEPLFSIESD
jgi:acetyl-CoA carboxylase biotin carboxyl carrier protein